MKELELTGMKNLQGGKFCPSFAAGGAAIILGGLALGGAGAIIVGGIYAYQCLYGD